MCHPVSIAYLEKFKYERERVESFADWPVVYIDADDLAMTGMFYTGQDDLVTCYFCHIKLHQWQIDDDVYGDHLKHSHGACRFLLDHSSTDNVPLDAAALKKRLPIIGEDVCGGGVGNSAKTSNSKRLESFRHLANLGFVYANNRIACFGCDADYRDGLSSGDHANDCNFIKDHRCKLCNYNRHDVAFLPCKHLASCVECSFTIDNDCCPLCRQKFKSTVQVNFS